MESGSVELTSNPFTGNDTSHLSLLSLDESGRDADVIREADIATQYQSQTEDMRDRNHIIVVVDTTYFYPLSSAKRNRSSDEGGIWALRGLSLSLKLGECFGLLGMCAYIYL